MFAAWATIFAAYIAVFGLLYNSHTQRSAKRAEIKSHRKNLRSALHAYINTIYESYDVDLATGEKRDINDEITKSITEIEETDGKHTPLLVVDQTTGISIQFLLKEYAFLESDVMTAVADLINVQNLIIALANELNTDYVRSLPAQRKANIVQHLGSLMKDAKDKAKTAANLTLQEK